MSIIELREDSFFVPKGKYWIKPYDCRAYSTVCKVLRLGDVFTQKYHYALFRNGKGGHMVKRKERAIPEQDQLWEDVCEIMPYKEGEIPA